MAENILECKQRKQPVDPPSSSSDSEADDAETQEKEKQLEEENLRKQAALEDQQRRLKKRIERKRRRAEEAAASSSSTSPGPEATTIHQQFTKILEQLNTMKMDCTACKKIENPKSQMDFLKAIYIY